MVLVIPSSASDFGILVPSDTALLEARARCARAS